MDSISRSIVIFIHGTGTAASEDEGNLWWQRNSQFWDQLNIKISPHHSCGPQDGRLYHWSGENSEAERQNAGENLLEWLESFESTGCSYHLVCHSHGGSIAWKALCEAVRVRKELKGLKTWTTLGTPFLHCAVDSSRFLLSIPFVTAIAILFFSRSELSSLYAYSSDLIADDLYLQTGGLILVFLFILLMTLVLGYSLFQHFILTLKQQKRLSIERSAFQRYGDRWFGMSSKADEAINGLLNTLRLQGEIVPRARSKRMAVTGKVFAILTTPFRIVYNYVVAPITDEFIWDRVTRRLQGIDIVGLKLVEVRRSPLGQASAPVSQQVERQLVFSSNASASETLSKIRDALGLAAQSGDELPALVTGFKQRFTWQELVHTNYFQNEEIIETIASNILGMKPFCLQAASDPLSSGTSSDYQRRPPTHRAGIWLALSFKLLGLVGVLLIALIFLQLFHGLYVYPFTGAYQVEQILKQTPFKQAAVEKGQDASRIVAVWIAALYAKGHETQGLEHLRERRDLLDDTLIALLERDHFEGVRRLLVDVKKIGQERGFTKGFTNIIRKLCEKGEFGLAVKSAEILTDVMAHGLGRAILAEEYAKQGNIEQAIVQAKLSGDISTYENISQILTGQDKAQSVLDIHSQLKSELEQKGQIRLHTTKDGSGEFLDFGTERYDYFALVTMRSTALNAMHALMQAARDQEAYELGKEARQYAKDLVKNHLLRDTNLICSPNLEVFNTIERIAESGLGSLALQAAVETGCDNILLIVASKLSALGLVEIAESAAEQLLPEWRDEAFRSVLVAMSRQGKTDELMRVSYKIQDKVKRSSALWEASKTLADLSLTESALKVAEHAGSQRRPISVKALKVLIRNQIAYFSTMVDIADKFRLSGNQTKADEIYTAIKNLALRGDDKALSYVWREFAKRGMLEDAQYLLKGVKGQRKWDGVTAALAIRFAECGNGQMAIMKAMSIRDDKLRNSAFAASALAVAAYGQDAAALEIFNRMFDSGISDRDTDGVVDGIPNLLAVHGFIRRATMAASYIESKVRPPAAVEQPFLDNPAYEKLEAKLVLADTQRKRIADVIAQKGNPRKLAVAAILDAGLDRDDLWEVIDKALDPEAKDEILNDLSQYFSQVGQFQMAFDIAARIGAPELKAEAIIIGLERIPRRDLNPFSIWINTAAQECGRIRDIHVQSHNLRRVGIAYASIRSYRKARQLCEVCLPIDKLGVYGEVLLTSADVRGVV
jgi:hypothetical protein